jgi:short-subunit dehydrogenase
VIDRMVSAEQACLAQRRSGAVVGIGSVSSIGGLPGHGAYCASKAAVISWCESLRGELRTIGVKVVTICPDYIDTSLTWGNPHSMPFLMPASDFSQKAIAAIKAGASYRVIPWQMGIVAIFLRALPNFLFDRLFAGRPRKPRTHGK